MTVIATMMMLCVVLLTHTAANTFSTRLQSNVETSKLNARAGDDAIYTDENDSNLKGQIWPNKTLAIQHGHILLNRGEATGERETGIQGIGIGHGNSEERERDGKCNDFSDGSSSPSSFIFDSILCARHVCCVMFIQIPVCLWYGVCFCIYTTHQIEGMV